MVDVDRAAVLLQVQRPGGENKQGGQGISGQCKPRRWWLRLLTWIGRAALWGIWEVCSLRRPAAGWSRCRTPRLNSASPGRRSASSRDLRYESMSTRTCRDAVKVKTTSRHCASHFTEDKQSAMNPFIVSVPPLAKPGMFESGRNVWYFFAL